MITNGITIVSFSGNKGGQMLYCNEDDKSKSFKIAYLGNHFVPLVKTDEEIEEPKCKLFDVFAGFKFKNNEASKNVINYI